MCGVPRCSLSFIGFTLHMWVLRDLEYNIAVGVIELCDGGSKEEHFCGSIDSVVAR